MHKIAETFLGRRHVNLESNSKVRGKVFCLQNQLLISADFVFLHHQIFNYFLMMETETVSETFGFDLALTRLVAREDLLL
jgi:hypothetical protein